MKPMKPMKAVDNVKSIESMTSLKKLKTKKHKGDYFSSLLRQKYMLFCLMILLRSALALAGSKPM
jgi:hypothetical protein